MDGVLDSNFYFCFKQNEGKAIQYVSKVKENTKAL